VSGESVPSARFFFGAMSPYSWLAAERIDVLLPDAQWRPVLPGVVFEAHGRTSWGFTGERQKGIDDCEKRAQARGLGQLHWPDPWPTNDLHAARAMVFADRLGLLKELALATMRLAFLESTNLEIRDSVLEAGRRVGIDSAELEAALADPEIKQDLRSVNDEALAAGVFGVPTVLVGDELFWGDDRLEDAAEAYRAQRTA
jgi:2-hydroxychromene-2-carboxylate isomerase